MAVDELLIKKVIEEYGNFIYRLALHYVGCTADAEDIVQEVLLALLTHSPGERKIKGWIAKVTVNKSLNLIKKRKKVTGPLSENASVSPDLGGSLSEELERLSPTDREIVYLCCYAGYTSNEVAKIIKLSPSAVRKRLERAKIKLKNYLKEDI